MNARFRARVSLISGGLLLIALVAWLFHLSGGVGMASHDAGWQVVSTPGSLFSWRGLQYVSLVAAAVVAGSPIAVSAAKALRFRAFSIDLLVTIAVTGALTIGEFVEAGVVAFLFVFGSWLEARTLERTRRSVSELIDMAPEEAEVLRDGRSVVVPVEEVVEGDHVLVRIGTRVPVDGHVLSGGGHVDEATITGESVPAEKTEGDLVYSGTMVTDGFMTLRADSVGDETAFARIIELVEDAQDSKSSTQRFLDRFSRIYTPAIIVAAALAFLVTRDAHFALTFLVIACPGALVISTPVSMVAGMGNGARHGVLLKGGDAVERLAASDTLVVDKTGTLTHGRPEVTDVIPLNRTSEEHVLRLAAGVESASEHPLGRAVVTAAEQRHLNAGEPQDVSVHAGSGISGRVEGTAVAVGSRRLVAEYGLALDDAHEARAAELEAGGATVFFVLTGEPQRTVVSGMIAVADTVRPEARSIAQLHEYGIERIIMLTGDNPRTAGAVAGELGIDDVRAELLPEDKVTAVRELTEAGHKVAMIGDGINDAPAIAASHVGVAMGTGTDVSIDTADVVLAGSRFDQLLHARQLTRATVANVRQNTAIALITVAGLILGVLAGAVFMSLGMLIHEASVVIVVLNAVRLVRYRSAEQRQRPSHRADTRNTRRKESVAA